MLSHCCPKKSVLKVAKRREKLNQISKIRAAVASPEKAGVGGSTPSLATTYTDAGHNWVTIPTPSIQHSACRCSPGALGVSYSLSNHSAGKFHGATL